MKISGGLYKTSRTNAWRCNMSAKFVRYNGGTMSYYGCTEPKDLVVGKIYEVTWSNVRAWQTDYNLKGVKGQFNSVWFDDVPIHKAIASVQPTVGHSMVCIKVEQKNGDIAMTNWLTTKVERVDNINPGIYRAITHNSIYDIMVP